MKGGEAVSLAALRVPEQVSGPDRLLPIDPLAGTVPPRYVTRRDPRRRPNGA